MPEPKQPSVVKKSSNIGVVFMPSYLLIVCAAVLAIVSLAERSLFFALLAVALNLVVLIVRVIYDFWRWTRDDFQGPPSSMEG